MATDRDDMTGPEGDFEQGDRHTSTRVDGRLGALQPGEIDDAQFRLLADNVPSLCWIARGDGYIVWYNRRWHEYCGTTPEEMEGWGWQSVHDPERLPEVMERWTRSIKTGEPFEMTFPLKGADGVFRPFLTRIQPIRDASGEIVRWFGVNTDITAQVAAEKARRATEKQARLIADSLPVLIAYVDADKRYRFTNSAYEQWFGRPRDALVGASLREILGEAAYARVRPMADRALAGERLTYEMPLPHSDGSCRPVEVQCIPDRRRDGSVSGYYVLVQDISDRKEAEQGLRESEERYRGLLSASNQVLYRHSADWSEMRQLSGGGFLADTPAPDPNWFDAYIHPDDQPDVWAAIQEAIRTKSLFELEHRVVREDGTLGWILSRSIPILDAEGEIVEWFGAASDVSARHEAEDALLESEVRFRALVNATSDVVYRMSADWTEIRQLDGRGFLADTENPRVRWIDEYIFPEDQSLVMAAIEEAIRTKGVFQLEHRVRQLDGSAGWTFSRAIPLLDGKGDIVEWFGTATDITERKRGEAWREAQRQVLELAIRDTSLHDALEVLVRTVEEQASSGMLASILLLDEDGVHLRHGAAPSLPSAYNDAIDGVAIGPEVGSCGTAAWRKEPVYVSDIAADPLWAGFRDLALGHGLRACWSTPIFSGQGDVLGTFAMYYPAPREPASEDLELVDFVTRSASLLIERKRAEQALHEETRTLETLNRTGAAVAAELHLENLVQGVTDAGVDLTGAEFGAFFYNVLDEQGESYMLYTLSGVDRSAFDKFPMPRNTAVFGPTFKGEGVVRSDDITADPRYGRSEPYRGMPEGHLPVRSYLAVPVASRSGEVIGGLFFGHSEKGRFTGRHERLMTGIAGQAAIGIDNARLFQSAQREIAERRRAEQALRDNEERLRLVQAAGGIGSFDYDLQQDDAICSPEYYALFGLPEGSPINRETWLGVIHPEDRKKALEALDRSIAERRAFDYEYRIVRADDGETRWLSGRAAIIFDAEDRPRRYVGGNIDITARRDTEEAVRRLNEELETRVEERTRELRLAEESLRQAQKMEAVGQLTGGVAHDFNNLLTVVIGNIDMGRRALEAAGGDARTRRALDNALRGAERAAALTERLLAFARRQPLQPKPVDIDKLVLGMSDLLGRSLGETVKLEIVSSPGLWRVEADPNQLEAAILNLAVNARDAMPKGGELTIETANARIDEAYTASHAEVAPGSYVVVAVTDSGHGMSKDMISRVFEPFFTTKEVGKGTGLGLSMVYGFVKQSGGHVKIYSEEGEGTTVKIYLPRFVTSGEAEEEEAAPVRAVEHSQAEETLLVVEDDDDVRGYTAELLREIGYRVLEAHDGPSALRLLERQESPIDLLFTDVVMPGMSGRELAEEVRKLHPGLKILYTSGYTRDAIIHGGRLDPGVDLIVKPFTYQALARKVRDMIDTGRSGRLLVVENGGGGGGRDVAAMLRDGDYVVDATPRPSEALGKVRANGGFYDAVVIDLASTGKAGKTLVAQLRGLHRDLPLLLGADEGEAELRHRFADDRCIAVVGGDDEGRWLEALTKLGIRCAAGAHSSARE